MIIKLPSTELMPNGYNFSVLNYDFYNKSYEVVVKSQNVPIDGLSEKVCGPNMSCKIVASNSTENQWVSIGGSNTIIKDTKVITETNVTSDSYHTIEIFVNSSDNNNIFIFPNNNYARVHKSYATMYNDPGYKVILNRENLYPGFRISVGNYSPFYYQEYGKNIRYNANLSVNPSNGVKINNQNGGVSVSPWYVHITDSGTKSAGYSNSQCATFMFDGANWWNVRA